MIAMQETSTWQEGHDVPNHTYVFKTPPGRTGNCIAYIKAGTNKVIKLKTPLVIDLRNRTFVTVK